MTYIPNFVSEEQFYPLPPEEKAALREKYGIPEGKFIVFCAGQLQRRKGFFDYIELARRMPDVLFLWAGSFAFGLISDGHDEIKAILENPPENFRLLGLVERERMNELYNLTDLMLLPSFEELFPMTILEAMNCHTPVSYTHLAAVWVWAGDSPAEKPRDSQALPSWRRMASKILSGCWKTWRTKRSPMWILWNSAPARAAV